MKKAIFLPIIICAFSVSSFAQSTKVKIETNKGTMVVMLYDDTPLHRDNFIKLVKSGFYNDLLFHRVIKNFMIQGGDPDSKNVPAGQQLGMGGPGYTIPAEFNVTHFHKKGALAAARMGDNVNPKRESSGSQFYIVQGQVYTDMQLDQFENRTGTTYTEKQRDAYTTIGGTPHLDNQYTVFGEIVDGLDIVDKIANEPTASGDRPLKDVKIINISILK